MSKRARCVSRTTNKPSQAKQCNLWCIDGEMMKRAEKGGRGERAESGINVAICSATCTRIMNS